jgi:CubicO group peptidase (beta-lactamase class C family)
VSDTSSLPRTLAVIEDGLSRGLHVGAQLHVDHGGTVVEDIAVGRASATHDMTVDTMMIWFSSTKAVTSVAAAKVWEGGGFDLDDPVAMHIPEFGRNGKEAVTVRHLFTHTAGFRYPSGKGTGAGMFAPWDDALKVIYEAPLEDGWIPGQRAGYHPGSTMHVLGELVHRIDGRPFPEYVREEVFLPLGMDDCWIGMPPEQHAAYGDRIGVMHNTEAAPRPVPMMDGPEACSRCVPGGNGRGPMRQLARLYRMLRAKGTLDGVTILRPTTVDAMTARHRVGLRDETFGILADWGLGMIIDGWWFGHHGSRRTFGHAGARSSIGFCDPEAGLVVAFVLNGLPKPADHFTRQLALTTAIYEDLGLGTEADRRTDRPVPGAAGVM